MINYRNAFTNLFMLIVLTGFIISCSEQKQEREKAPVPEVKVDSPKALVEKVLTAEEQAALKPDEIIQSLKDGNKGFRTNNITARDHSTMIRQAAGGQYPKAVILSCLDSRVPVEDVFDKGIGSLFVARVAGNFANDDILGSMEYACKVAGAKVIVVLGHEYCGAVKAAIDNVQLGNMTNMLAKIKPAVVMSRDFDGEKSTRNNDYVTYVAVNNVKHTMATIRDKSPILKAMLDKGEIKMIGAFYNMETGEVIFME
jgi:carbonic anhydrase